MCCARVCLISSMLSCCCAAAQQQERLRDVEGGAWSITLLYEDISVNNIPLAHNSLFSQYLGQSGSCIQLACMALGGHHQDACEGKAQETHKEDREVPVAVSFTSSPKGGPGLGVSHHPPRL